MASELAALERAIAAIAPLRSVDDINAHHAAFRAAAVALARQDEASRRATVAALDLPVPASGPARVFVLSWLAAVAGDSRYLVQIQQTLATTAFTHQQRHFFYWQVLTRHSHLPRRPELEPASMYAALLEQYRRSANVPAARIAPADRDRDCVVVITSQLLGVQHAPTADCLDYCRVLQAALGKRVILINTADMPWTLPLAYYEPMRFNRLEEYTALRRLTFKDQTFEFYQCEKPMPNLGELRAILETVRTRRPLFVFSLGHSNVAADLCSQFVTVATMPFGTDLPRAKSDAYILPRARRTADAAFMERWGIGAEQIIEAEYTFRLPERSASFTRARLGLPADAYVIAVVGNRLADEVTPAVAAQLADLLAAVPEAFVAFLGTFPNYEDVVRHSPALRERTRFLGYHQDVQAVYECCDAYFNPPRYGGGSSAAFALAMGLPVMTANGGDVANIAGPAFILDSPEAIRAAVARLAGDRGYRAEQSAAARARFAEISDRERMLTRILTGVEARL